jgi:ketosteroid isomerase-like protein
MRFIVPLPLLFLSCCPSLPELAFTNGDELAIRAVMAGQELAWDNADIDGFMEGYADTVCFLSPKGRTCGRDAVTANYKRSYPDASVMGDLAFDVVEVIPAGADHAWVTGAWQLARTADTLSGGFSLLWVRQHQGWRIVRDHTH